MADRPIIFSGPMIRALLAGTKTQTRRALKPVPRLDHFASEHLEDFELRGFEVVEQPDGRHLVYRPQWRAGDRLWVHEAFIRYYELDGDDQPCSELLTCYRADGWPLAGWYDRDREETRDAPPWCSPIHMPRALSRLTLTVTEVRVQRLQDISEADARAEGAPRLLMDDEGGFYEHGDGLHRVGFAGLWAHLHGPASWDASPWVAAISFRSTPANIDSLPEQTRSSVPTPDQRRS